MGVGAAGGFWPDAGGDVLERLEQTGTPEWHLLAEHTAELGFM